MALLPCPSCALLRTPEDLASAACPVCGHRPGDAVPATDTALTRNPEPVQPLPPFPIVSGEPSPWGNRLLVGGVLGAAGVVLAAMLKTTPGFWPSASPTEPALTVPISANLSPNSPPDSVELAPMPREYVWQPFTPSGPELAPYPRPVVIAPLMIRLNRPNDDFKLDRVGEGNHIRLVGQVKRLLLDGAFDGATIDASELAVKEVYFYGRIDGGAAVKLKCTDGKISFQQGIGGGSTVEVDSGTGTVTFPTTGGNGRKSTITEGATVRVTGKTVTFAGLIDGSGTRVHVTLTPGGGLRFVQMDGSAKLLYRTASPLDPLPRLYAGELRGKAECRRVE